MIAVTLAVAPTVGIVAIVEALIVVAVVTVGAAIVVVVIAAAGLTVVVIDLLNIDAIKYLHSASIWIVWDSSYFGWVTRDFQYSSSKSS